MNEHIQQELADREEADQLTSTHKKRGRPSKLEAEKNELLAEKKKLEEEIESSPDRDEIKAALAAGRERLDPRAESQAERDGGRIPLGSPHQKLSVRGFDDQLDGYVPRWINDDGDRIMRALQGGYQPVIQNKYFTAGDGDNMNSDKGSWVSQPVGSKKNGEPMRAYLLKLRKDLYEEDQKAKQDTVRDVQRAIKTGQLDVQGDSSNRYVDKDRTRLNF